MSKDYEFISEEEWEREISQNFGFDIYGDSINKFLNNSDKCQKGYTSIDEGGNSSGFTKDYWVNQQTHKAYVFLQPLEPEKVECTRCERMKRSIALDVHPVPIPNFCDNCGEKLK